MELDREFMIEAVLRANRNTGLGLIASDYAMLYVLVSPTGPYFQGKEAISLLAVSENVRAWPGGTGGDKVAGNYSPCFLPQRVASEKGYDQILWLFGEDKRITEAGAMNFFVVLKREDGDGECTLTFPKECDLLIRCWRL